MAPADRRLSLATKLFYGFGSVAFGVKDNGFSYLLLIFYNQVIGLPGTLVGLALMIALVFDACIDPLIGQLSDNLRSPWGRRHPFMYAAAAAGGALLCGAVEPAALGPSRRCSVYLIVTAIVIRTFISFYEVPSSALAAEFSAGYDERSVLLSYRYFFGWVGGLALNCIAFFFLFRPDATHKVGQLNPVGYAHYGMVGGGGDVRRHPGLGGRHPPLHPDPDAAAAPPPPDPAPDGPARWPRPCPTARSCSCCSRASPPPWRRDWARR